MKSSLFTTFFKYVSLSTLGMISLSCYILADTFFIANGLGNDALTALNLAISMCSVINGIGLMLGIGGATKFVVSKAQSDSNIAETTFTHTLMLGMIMSLILILIGVCFVTPLSKLLGADAQTLEMTSVYLRTILCFAPCYILNSILLAFIRNDGHPQLAMLAMIISSFANIILDYIFIFPLGMGMFGAAFATSLAPLISIGILSPYLMAKKNTFHLKKSALNLKLFTSICSLGVSSLTTELSSGIVLMVFNLIILGLTGNTGVAAYGIVANLALVVTSIFVGISQGIQPLVSKHYGLGEFHISKKLLHYALTLTLILSVFLYLLTFIFTDDLISLFNSEGDRLLREYAAEGLHIYFMGFLFAGINIITAAYLSATEKPRHAFILSITRACLVLIPFAFILSSLLGMPGVWLSFPVTEGLVLLLAISLVKEKKKSLQGEIEVV